MLTYEDKVHFSQTKSWKRYFVRTNAAVLKFPILQHVGRAGVRFKVNCHCEMFWFDSQTMVCDGDIVSVLLWIVGVHGLRDCGSSRSRGGYSPGSAFGRFRGWAGLEGECLILKTYPLPAGVILNPSFQTPPTQP